MKKSYTPVSALHSFHTKENGPACRRVKRKRFTLIELLVVIAIIAITLRSKSHFFLLFSAILDFLPLLQRIHNFQKRDVTL